MTATQDKIINGIVRAMETQDWSSWTPVVGGYRYDIPGVGRLFALNLDALRHPTKLWFEMADNENATPTRYLVTTVSKGDGLGLVLKSSWDLTVVIRPRKVIA